MLLGPKVATDSIIQKAFDDGQNQWIDDPIISQWRDAGHRIHKVLGEANELHKSWSASSSLPFAPSSDRLWAEAGRAMAQAGLPWHTNQLGMPTELDTSFEFHFKYFEQLAIREKGARVGDANAAGYVSNPYEANCYCIRALQQDLRETCPTSRPVLVYDNFNQDIIRSAEILFGLDLYRVNLKLPLEDIQRDLRIVTGGNRPIIFAASLAAENGGYDDLTTISEISQRVPLLLHVDASRNFDYITTLSKEEREKLGVEQLKLDVKPLRQPLKKSTSDGSSVIVVSSLAAGGANHTYPAPVVALKPASLGGKSKKVAYIRGLDSTLAGSRDAMTSLWMALQEIRFGAPGFQTIYQRCASMRTALMEALSSLGNSGVSAFACPYSLDVIIQSCSKEQTDGLLSLGGVLTGTGGVMLTLQPSVGVNDISSVLKALVPSATIPIAEQVSAYTAFSTAYRVPQHTIDELSTTVQTWKIRSRSAAGYPLHLGSYSALGPVIGRFLDLEIPGAWLDAASNELLKSRMQTFGLRTQHEISQFKASFTNGSTMGNRLGIHAALAKLPGAFVYFSAESHYSVSKTVQDCDLLTNRWSARRPRYTCVPCDNDGRMMVDALVKQALSDWEYCLRHGEEYRMVLFANMGTTFLGARDDLKRICSGLLEVGIQISYIHIDGALDFGYGNCGVTLGPPGVTDQGMPVVQGITVSHHKVMGGMVSGEVFCWSPTGNRSPCLDWKVDPRIIFEAWLYAEAYSQTDLTQMFRYGRQNALLLEADLKRIGFATKLGPDSVTVVLERPPAWIVEEFSLRPEGNWVHFITMAHISHETIDLFCSRLSSLDKQCLTAFSYIRPLLTAAMKRPVKLNRLFCQSSLAERVTRLAMEAAPAIPSGSSEWATVLKTAVRSALSVVVLDNCGQIEAVLLINSLRDSSMRVGPLLLQKHHLGDADAIVDISKQLAGFMARHMRVTLQVDSSSYALYEM
ncbi:hypothetical protein DRE_03239 [Drechslerella stenobrocha 248]|uniref:Pyridoxal phosphate-dependent transferase n=1 Tax=Drechslerella stenobrocha 248 TaxID=1043628 RepID=W7HVS6_9PEZI|nr:hypothetical protein DRE_03239 [Drechslerella stenobrocha 248]